MKAFCVLFLVLLNNIGNQGDPIHGLINFQSAEVPTYLVSVRNASDCHMCTGTMISVSWGLTAIECIESTHIKYLLREFTICENYTLNGNGVLRVISHTQNDTSTALLFKVGDDKNRRKMSLPSNGCFNFGRPDFGKVIGWSFDHEIRKFVMVTFNVVHIEGALSETFQAYLNTYGQLSAGSPLIDDSDVIYGFFTTNTTPFYNILDHKAWIKAEIKK